LLRIISRARDRRLDGPPRDAYPDGVDLRGDRHRHAADTHDEAAARHEDAVAFWLERGDGERADLERRNAEIERAAASLERERADLDDRSTAANGG
jgi:hypothetical protein